MPKTRSISAGESEIGWTDNTEDVRNMWNRLSENVALNLQLESVIPRLTHVTVSCSCSPPPVLQQRGAGEAI